MNNLKISIVLVALFLASCANKNNEEKTTSDKTIENVNSNLPYSIPLNNGERWKVDEKMLTFLEESRQHLITYNANPKNEDYLHLANILDSLNTQFIKSCTMKDEAHDALHQWLEPHMKLISTLKNTNNEIDVQKHLSQLNTSFETFNKYFH